MKNKAAVSLGKLAKGVPKKFSKAELERRRQRMRLINANSKHQADAVNKRWAKRKAKGTNEN